MTVGADMSPCFSWNLLNVLVLLHIFLVHVLFLLFITSCFILFTATVIVLLLSGVLISIVLGKCTDDILSSLAAADT